MHLFSSPIFVRRTLMGASALVFALCGIGADALAQQNVQFLQNINLVAGTGGTAGYTGDGGPAALATFAASTQGAISDPFGNFFILDGGNSVVRRVDAVTGIITTFAGGAKTVCSGGDKYGNGCPATQATLNNPRGIRYFRGDIYIVDDNNNQVRIVSGTTGIISAFYGTGGTALSVGGKASNATAVFNPVDIVFDAAGNAYVPSDGAKPFITKIAATTGLPGTGIVSVIAGNGTVGNLGDGGPASAATLQTPTAAAIDPQGNLYFAFNTPQTIRQINITTGIITTVVGPSGGGTAGFSGDGGPANLAQLNSPQHLVFDGSGNLYIADALNHRVRMVTPPAAGALYGTITTFAGSSTPGGTGNGGPVSSSTLTTPRGVDFTPAGDLLIMDGGTRQLRIVSPPNVFAVTAVGATTTQTAFVQFLNSVTLASIGVQPGYQDFSSGVPSGCAAGAAATAGSMCSITLNFQPTASGIRSAPFTVQSSTGTRDNLQLTGLANAPAAALLPGLVTAVAGTGVAGNSGDSAAANAARLNLPLGVAVDGQNNYYIADSANNEVRKITAATGVITRVAGTGAVGFSGDGALATLATLRAPAAVAVDGAGNLYIADTGNNRIRLVNAATGLISTFAGTGVAGFAGDTLAATSAQLSAPQGLYLASSGVLFVADTGNNLVRAIGTRSGSPTSASIITTIAGTGVANYIGDTGVAQLAQLNAPTAVAVDNSGNLYIADTGNQVIRKVNNSIITTYAGVNTAGYSDGVIATAMFNAPSGLAVDAAGDLYVADSGNHAIRRISGGISTTVAGTGKAGLTGNGGTSTAAALSGPRGVALDLNGNILIADSQNSQLRSINVSAASIAFPSTSPNTTSATRTVSLTNAGSLPLTIANVAVPAGFAEVASGATDCNGAGTTLAPGAACQTSVVFKPTAAQTYNGSVVITDNSQNQATASQSIAVSGTGAYVFTATISAPSTAVAGSSQSVTVSVTNPVTVYKGTVHFTTSDPSPSASLPADYTFTAADNGTHTFSGLKLSTAGTQTITVADTVTPSITASAVVSVVGGPPASLQIVSGNGQSALITSSYTLPLVIKALDASGNASAGASITFTAPSTGADATFNGAATFTAVTNALGLVSSPLPLADGVIGTYAVIASSTGISPVSFSLTNTSNVALGFSLASTPAGVYSLPVGGSATTTLTLTPLGGFNAPVNVSCSGAIATTTCQLSEAVVPPSGNGTSSNFTLTVTTSGPARAQSETARGLIFSCFLVFSIGLGLRKRRALRGIVLAMVCCWTLLALGGCSSNNFGSETLPVSYTLTITATSGSLINTLTIPVFVGGKT